MADFEMGQTILYVRDPASAAALYKKAFGWEVAYAAPGNIYASMVSAIVSGCPQPRRVPLRDRSGTAL
jgi:hypothetical protein